MAVDVVIRPEDTSGIPVLGQLVRLVPMLVVAGLVTVAATLVTVPMAVSVVVAGRVPTRLAAFQVWSLRQRTRTFTGFLLLRADTPRFPRSGAGVDPGDDPIVRVSVDVPQALPRWAPLVHAARAGVHLLGLFPLAIVVDLLLPVWLVAVIVRGWSPTTRARLVAMEQWAADVIGHAWLVNADPPRARWADLTGRPVAVTRSTAT